MRQAALLLAIFALTLLGCSSGEQVAVPNLHQLSVVDAYTKLRELGLRVEIDGPITVASNHVSWVDGHAPEAGNEVDVGSVVTLHPGSGPIGSIFAVKEPDAVRLPDLGGLRLDVAVKRLDSLGLLWATRPMPALPASDEPTLLEHYVVTATRPGPGEVHDQYHRRGNASTVTPLTIWAELAND